MMSTECRRRTRVEACRPYDFHNGYEALAQAVHTMHRSRARLDNGSEFWTDSQEDSDEEQVSPDEKKRKTRYGTRAIITRIS